MCSFQCSGSSRLHDLHEWYEIDFDYGTPAYKTSTVGPYTQDFGGEEEYYIYDRNGGIFKSVLESLDEDHLRLNKVCYSGLDFMHLRRKDVMEEKIQIESALLRPKKKKKKKHKNK